MSIETKSPGSAGIIYPESDGQPMAENTRQFEAITTIKGGLDAVFLDAPDVFVAGDLFWYPVEGNNQIRTAPDIMVAFGRPKGHRGSYQQWREGAIANCSLDRTSRASDVEALGDCSVARERR